MPEPAVADPTVELLQAALDAEPDNHEIRRVLADAVTEAGGDGSGWLALSLWQRNPILPWFHSPHVWWRYSDHPVWWKLDTDFLPRDWSAACRGGRKVDGNDHYRQYGSRLLAEMAAAAAFLQLPPERQRELLLGPP